ncbi:SDR family oxidoreductase [Georgenia faecalis]|uniref:SDR family oxidoreductase n=1 Tax=Georgenia faecalis TaxID=2483799 RepID=UPI001F4A0487|nr:hypothetical protein [Georgenia faecalis]
MRVAVVGGGPSGRAIERALVERGATATLVSRSTGFDVLRDDAVERLGGSDVIVEATGHATTSRTVATDFFTRSTRAVAAAAHASGARHVLLSIVHCDLPEVQGYGYFAGKAAQERLAREVSDDLVIVRSTAWFEFARQSLDRFSIGPLALVTQMRMKPVALDAVAGVIADVATGRRAGTAVDLAGPEVLTLWEMTRRLPDRPAVTVPLPVPGRLGRALRDGALVPGDDAEVVGPTYAEWLRAGSG